MTPSSKVWVMYDPSGTYPRGAWFYLGTFMKQLENDPECYWPPGMIVLVGGKPPVFRAVRGGEDIPNDPPYDYEFPRQSIDELTQEEWERMAEHGPS